MRELEKYVQENFFDELEKVRRDFSNEFPRLTDAEKTIIYKYTDDDFTFIGINQTLRRSEGLIVDDFAKYLDFALSKLPNYNQITYRGTELDEKDVEKYIKSYQNGTILTEFGFFSTSRDRMIAESYGDIFFKVFGKRGKSIEKISKFGAGYLENEEEVLFRKNTPFKVFNMSKSRSHTIFHLLEI